MPWDIKRNYGGCKGYAVVKDNGEVVGCHSTRSGALAQQRALYAAEPEAAKFWGGQFTIVNLNDKLPKRNA